MILQMIVQHTMSNSLSKPSTKRRKEQEIKNVHYFQSSSLFRLFSHLIPFLQYKQQHFRLYFEGVLWFLDRNQSRGDKHARNNELPQKVNNLRKFVGSGDSVSTLPRVTSLSTGGWRDLGTRMSLDVGEHELWWHVCMLEWVSVV